MAVSSSPMDESSDIYSLYSYPAPMTRASTVASAEPLVTPMDVPDFRGGLKRNVSGPRSMTTRRDNDMIRVYSQTSDAVRSRYGDRTLEIVPETQEHDPEPYGPYFSLPIAGAESAPASAALHRRRSTKDLIDRYESMYGSEDGSSERYTTGPLPSLYHSPSTVVRDLSPAPTEKTAKKRSPLRQSIRNLISMISKKSKSSSRESSYAPSVSQSVDPSVDITRRPPARDPFLDRPTFPEAAQAEAKSTACMSPTYALHSGPVLHLHRPSFPSSPIMPVWTRVDAILHATHLLLTSQTMRGTPSTSTVPLSTCFDVRSVPTRELDAEEFALLPRQTTTKNPKVFEVCFMDGSAERFAAPSVKERAAWVSAVWDAVLHSQEGKSIHERRRSAVTLTPRMDSEYHSTEHTESRPPSSLYTPSFHEPVASTPQGSLRSYERSLPPFPEAEEPLLDDLEAVPDLPNRTTLTVDTSPDRLAVPSSSSTSRPPSPSIMHLGRMSVVKQRLAAMQASTASSASQSSRDSRSSRSEPSTRLTTPASSRLSSVKSPYRSTLSSVTRSTEREPDTSIGSASRLTTPTSALSEDSAYTVSGRPKSVFRLRDERRQRDRVSKASSTSGSCRASDTGSELRIERPPTAMTRNSSSGDRPPSQMSATDEDMATLLDVMDVHAEIHQNQVAGIGEQIDAVHLEVKNMSEDMRLANTDRGQEIQQIIDMKGTLENLTNTIACNELVRSEPALDNAQILEILEDVRMQLKLDLPTVLRMLREVKQSSMCAPKVLSDPTPAISGLPADSSSSADVSLVNNKLDALLAICQALQSFPRVDGGPPQPETQGSPHVQNNGGSRRLAQAESQTSNEILEDAAPRSSVIGRSSVNNIKGSSIKGSSIKGSSVKGSSVIKESSVIRGSCFIQGDNEGSSSNEQLQEVLNFLREDHGQRTQQMEQQADSVRYLNELNTWLEAFVSSGTAQIQDVATGIKQLCKEFGASDETEMHNEGGGEGRPNTVLADLRQFLAESEARGRDGARLQSTVDGLIAAINEDMRKNAEMRSTYTTESVIGFIDRQRQDQERMLRAIATELSNDIRGERLRFVEAMKEATAINVQVHVEEFKKELTREVLLMTQEVSRLQRERQTLEQQIADLFSFYAKQKHAATVATPRAPSVVYQQAQTPQISEGSQSNRRALPHPPDSSG